MKFLVRILLVVVVLYALAGVAFAFLHYPGERPGAGQIVEDFHDALLGVFRTTASPTAVKRPADGTGTPSLDDLRGDVDTDLSRISIPDSGSISADAAKTWDALRSLRDDVLPRARRTVAQLGRLKSADPSAFETKRAALGLELARARGVLESMTASKMPHTQADQLLDALGTIEARWRAL